MSDPNNPERFTLPRDGQAPLSFRGELIAEEGGQHTNGRENNRWHEMAVYRTLAQKYVVAIAYRTRWQGEEDRDFADVVNDPAGVETVLREYDPTAPVAGFPAGPAYAERQGRLMADVRGRYDAQVSRLLSASPEFALEVE